MITLYVFWWHLALTFSFLSFWVCFFGRCTACNMEWEQGGDYWRDKRNNVQGTA